MLHSRRCSANVPHFVNVDLKLRKRPKESSVCCHGHCHRLIRISTHFLNSVNFYVTFQICIQLANYVQYIKLKHRSEKQNQWNRDGLQSSRSLMHSMPNDTRAHTKSTKYFTIEQIKYTYFIVLELYTYYTHTYIHLTGQSLGSTPYESIEFTETLVISIGHFPHQLHSYLMQNGRASL